MTKPNGMRGLAHLPRQPIPAGRFLVHNQVIPCGSLGAYGFRAWTQDTRRGLVRCHCDFGGCKNAELHKHYRVQLGDNAKERAAVKAGNDACQKVMREGGAKLAKDGAPVGGFAAINALRQRASTASQKAYITIMGTAR
jgi:hypothetical protein